MTEAQAQLLRKLRDAEAGLRIPKWNSAEHKAWMMGWFTGVGNYYFITPDGIAALAAHEEKKA